MVNTNYENDLPGTAAVLGPAHLQMGPGKPARVLCSSASSLGSSSNASTITTYSERNSPNPSDDFGDKLDLNIHRHHHHTGKLGSSLTASSSSSFSDDFEDDEHIKLLCGDHVQEEDFLDLDRIHRTSSSHCSSRRRRIFTWTQLGNKFRRKLNWQLFLFVAVLLVVFLCMSQLNEYEYKAAGIAGWTVNTTREAAVYILPGKHTALLQPRVVDRGKRYLLLVIVCSAVDNFSTRQMIRQTWANGSEFNYQNYFHRMHSHARADSFAPVSENVMRRVSGQLFPHETSPPQPSREPVPITEHGRQEDHGELIRRLQSQVIFLVGQPQANATQQLLAEESATFGDILQEQFLDTYNNLTLKSLMLLKWINHFNDDADRVKFVMKCDDDTFLNLPNLVHVLLGGSVPIYEDTLKLYTAESLPRTDRVADNASEEALMGFLFRSAKPIRDATSKWYAPKYMYRKKIFPNYLSGTGYVIEATVAAKLLFRAAMHTPIFHLEDVYVTGLCASRSVRTKPHHNPLFSYLRHASHNCALRGMITQHPMTEMDIRNSYDRLVGDGSHCDQPSTESVEKVRANARSRGNSVQYSTGLQGVVVFVTVLVTLLRSQ